jgi:hypothetical protein
MNEGRLSTLTSPRKKDGGKQNNYRKNEILLKNFFILLTIFMLTKSVLMYLWELFVDEIQKQKMKIDYPRFYLFRKWWVIS